MANPAKPPRVTIVTASNPGAVGVVQLCGEGVEQVLQTVTDGGVDWPVARVRLVRFGDYDRGLAVKWRDDWAQLMPHGGPAVVRKLLDACLAAGATYQADPPSRSLFPEAETELEADLLRTLARAASPAAIDLLLAQPLAWRRWLKDANTQPRRETQASHTSTPPEAPSHDDNAQSRNSATRLPDADELLARAHTLQRLIDPPAVVVVGPPNVGKSTLANALLGRAASLVADLPGTTRDWVAGLVELSVHSPQSAVRGQVRGPQSAVRSQEQKTDKDDHERADAERLRTADRRLRAVSRTDVAVRWMDTPGLRVSDDVIEQDAIALANQVIAAAEVLIAMRDPATDFPAAAALPREPDLWVINKADLLHDDAPVPRDDAPASHGDEAHNSSQDNIIHTDAPTPGQSPHHPLLISAATGAGVAELQHAVLTRLALADLPRDAPWPFNPRLRELLLARDLENLRDYIGAHDPR